MYNKQRPFIGEEFYIKNSLVELYQEGIISKNPGFHLFE